MFIFLTVFLTFAYLKSDFMRYDTQKYKAKLTFFKRKTIFSYIDLLKLPCINKKNYLEILFHFNFQKVTSS